MGFKHPGIVHGVNVVAGQDEHILRNCQVDEVQVLVDGICRTLIPVCSLLTGVGRQDEDTALTLIQIPGAAGSQIVVQFQGAVLGQHAHLIDSRVSTVAQRKIDNTIFAAKRHGRLGDFLRQSPQAAALAACKNHC